MTPTALRSALQGLYGAVQFVTFSETAASQLTAPVPEHFNNLQRE
jgi:hypothetical protein